MYDFEARHIIEALRSGIPSRAVGQYFSEARPKIMKEISDRLDMASEQGKSCGMVISGKYGEGKTHLLNTVFTLAHSFSAWIKHSLYGLGRAESNIPI